MLSDLKKMGWLDVNLDSKDSRKRLYKLVDSNEAWNNILGDLTKK